MLESELVLMIAGTHFLLGASAGQVSAGLAQRRKTAYASAFLLGVALHCVDAIPHFEYSLATHPVLTVMYLAADTIALLLVITSLPLQKFFQRLVWVGVFGSALPDLLWIARLGLLQLGIQSIWLNSYIQLHWWVHAHTDLGYWGVLLQYLTFEVALTAFLFSLKTASE